MVTISNTKCALCLDQCNAQNKFTVNFYALHTSCVSGGDACALVNRTEILSFSAWRLQHVKPHAESILTVQKDSWVITLLTIWGSLFETDVSSVFFASSHFFKVAFVVFAVLFTSSRGTRWSNTCHAGDTKNHGAFNVIYYFIMQFVLLFNMNKWYEWCMLYLSSDE